MNDGTALNARWLYDSPVYSDVEAKLRRFLVDSANAGKILGVQVCAYKDGQVIIDTAAGVLGKHDPRPVQPDSLFPVFSATKGITAGMVHWLADKGKLKLDVNVANIWPEFGTNGKDQIKVNQILNHTSGLHNALAGVTEDRTLFCDWDECLKRIAMVAPETEPGREQLYHYLSYGWLCGGIIEEAFARPLNVEGELYIGIPPGVESRVATVAIDTDPTANPASATYMPSSLTISTITDIIELCNALDGRSAIVPAVNGLFSARALARFYSALVDGGVVPPRHPSVVHMNDENKVDTTDEMETKIFDSPKEKLHDAFLGNGDYKDLIFPNGLFGLGFWRFLTSAGSVLGFGHPGAGGSTAYCDINNRFAIAVTVNKFSGGALTGEIIRFICSELDLPVPLDYAG
ncbi:hypothetical protein M8C21_019267 [Ambrosia artemisiifolia]|uniref:Beta-lactamase-related domain-containing protein n=1 Tax=Ambrosia artemisiifolia TaxID=4212 RepID=A0AAD5G2T9_AMBAR|nr:hypothetical protein M8C21_019267 [Ambrosia artemisiifolia]